MLSNYKKQSIVFVAVALLSMAAMPFKAHAKVNISGSFVSATAVVTIMTKPEEDAWNKDVQEFMTTTGSHITRSRAAMEAFDEVVKKVTADPRNANLSNRAQLLKAYIIYMGYQNTDKPIDNNDIKTERSHIVTILGHGAATCGHWTEIRREDGPSAHRLEAWVLGYLSGVSKYSRDLDPTKNVDSDGISYWLDSYCAAHPATTISHALDAFSDDRPK